MQIKIKRRGLCLLWVIVQGLLLNVVWAKPLLAPALQKGDTVALVSSGSHVLSPQDISFAKMRLTALGLHVILGQHVHAEYGYLAGTAAQRAADLNAMFANPEVKAIFQVRGGVGSANILPLLNYELIKQHPKVVIGYSDITSLLIGIQQRTGLVTFHGPMAFQAWPAVTIHFLQQILFRTRLSTLENPIPPLDTSKDIIQTHNRIQTLISGHASGILIGGNLRVLTGLLGTPYEPDWHGKILFIEEVNESYERIDRMLAQLALAGVLQHINGLIFGACQQCYMSPDNRQTFTLNALLLKYLQPHPVPSYMGAMFGHQDDMFTLPEGVKVTMDADTGKIQLLSPAVK